MYRKKLRLLGLAVILIVNHPLWSSISLANGPQYQSRGSNSIDAIYCYQRRSLFCGQACVEMILLTIQGRSVSQFDLAKEMSYKEGVGTRNVYLSTPFEKRDLGIQSVGRYSKIDQLVRSVDSHQYSIINIRFDEKSNYGHYVVVTGYNETGFFVNDPWPEKWSDIVERDVGENAYLSDESLKKLWRFRKNWVITIAGPKSEHIPVVKVLITVKE